MATKVDAVEEQDIIPELGVANSELFDAMGGVTEAEVVDNRMYSAAFRREIDAQTKYPVFIPGEFAEIVQVNGLTFIINPEQVVLVPQTVKEILDNKRAMEREANQYRKRAKGQMNKTLAEMPEYIG